jgi:putative transposase
MDESISLNLPTPAVTLDELVKRGAQRMLQVALEAEVEGFLEQHAARRDGQGRRWVVRNGHLPQRSIMTGAGPLEVEQPRVRDRGPAEGKVQFRSTILPPYLRKSKAVEELIPWLYLKGVSTGDFNEALGVLLGPDAPGLSPNVVVRLKAQWQAEYEAWSQRSLVGKEYVYLWVDGVHFNVRLEDERQCILVVMGATAEGIKELVAVWDGFRESEPSWSELLRDLKARGLRALPKLIVGDGALGFWAAARKLFEGAVTEQRCTVHKTANVLDKLPKSVQPKAKSMLHEIWQAPSRKGANKAFDAFLAAYRAKYPKATACLEKDREALLAFFDFPAEHWAHLRSTNPIESTFATVRLRHRKTKGNGSRAACLAMVFKLARQAEKRWRKLNGTPQLLHLQQGKKFVDGIMQEAA